MHRVLSSVRPRSCAKRSEGPILRGHSLFCTGLSTVFSAETVKRPFAFQDEAVAFASVELLHHPQRLRSVATTLFGHQKGTGTRRILEARMWKVQNALGYCTK